MVNTLLVAVLTALSITIVVPQLAFINVNRFLATPYRVERSTEPTGPSVVTLPTSSKHPMSSHYIPISSDLRRKQQLLWIGEIVTESIGWPLFKTKVNVKVVGHLPPQLLSKHSLESSTDIGINDRKVTFEMAH